MTRKRSNKIIQVVHPICCGLGVHKNMVSACIIITEPDGEETFIVKENETTIIRGWHYGFIRIFNH